MRRGELGLTQEQLAERMGTSHSAISRIESGQHRTSVATLERLAAALEVRFVMGFETGPREAPGRELVWCTPKLGVQQAARAWPERAHSQPGHQADTVDS
jgi:transcriptional regulator with XRE-family HTH domain